MKIKNMDKYRGVWRKALNVIFEAIVIINPEHTIIECNRVFCNLLKKKKKDIVGKKCYALMHGEKQRLGHCLMCKAKKLGRKLELEYSEPYLKKILHLSANCYFDKDGRFEYGVHAIRDITAHRKSEEALRKSEEKYKSLVENLSGLVYRADPKTLRITYVNSAVKQIYGYNIKKWYKDPDLWMKAIHPDDRKRALAKFRQDKREMKNGRIDYRIIRKNKATLWVENIYGWEKDEQGRIVSLSGVIHDLSEQKKIEVMKDNLIRDVSHELKTPIAMMVMAYQMLQRGLDAQDTARIKKAQGVAEENLNRLSRDINRILDLFVLHRNNTAIKRNAVSLSKITDEIIRGSEYLIKQKKLKVRVDIPKGSDKILAQGKDIGTCLYNLIDNAVKFTEKGGISVIADSVGKKWVRLRVKDSGCGIARRDIGKVFEKFYQRHAAVPGTGLGLSICKEIVEMHKGSIKVSSAGVGRGTTVTVKLLRSQP